MFEHFYGFTKTPFGRDLKPSELFQTEQNKEMLARMKYTAERRNFALFTGEVGAGKSTAARLLTNNLHPTRYVVLYITDSDLTPRNFYYEALHQLGHQPSFTAEMLNASLVEQLLIFMKNKKRFRSSLLTKDTS